MTTSKTPLLDRIKTPKDLRQLRSSELKQLAKADDVDAEMQDLDLYKLLKVFQKVMSKYSSRTDETKHTVIQYPYTIEQQKDFILEKMSWKDRVAFTEFISYKPEKIFVIYTY